MNNNKIYITTRKKQNKWTAVSHEIFAYTFGDVFVSDAVGKK